MIENLNLPDENVIGFRVIGSLQPDDIPRFFAALVPKLQSGPPLRFYAEADGFNMPDVAAGVWEDLKIGFQNPGLMRRIEKCVLVTDEELLRKALAFETALLPSLTTKSFPSSEKDKALAWLRSGQDMPRRVDLTLVQLAELGTLKAAAGFALGLLLASCWDGERRQKIGRALLISTIIAGLPLSVYLINRLFGNGKPV